MTSIFGFVIVSSRNPRQVAKFGEDSEKGRVASYVYN